MDAEGIPFLVPAADPDAAQPGEAKDPPPRPGSGSSQRGKLSKDYRDKFSKFITDMQGAPWISDTDKAKMAFGLQALSAALGKIDNIHIYQGFLGAAFTNAYGGLNAEGVYASLMGQPLGVFLNERNIDKQAKESDRDFLTELNITLLEELMHFGFDVMKVELSAKDQHDLFKNSLEGRFDTWANSPRLGNSPCTQ